MGGLTKFLPDGGSPVPQEKNPDTWVILIPTTTHIPRFVTVAHTEIWIFALLLANQNRYANDVLNTRI